MRLLRSYGADGPQASLDAVLERAVVNAAIDHHRRATAQKRPREVAALAPDDDLRAAPEETEGAVASSDSGRVLSNAIAIALPRLSDDEQRILVLRLRDDLSLSEIGDRVGRAKSFCSKAFSSACEKLRPDVLEVQSEGLSAAQRELLFRLATRQELGGGELDRAEALRTTAAGAAHFRALVGRVEAVTPLLPAVAVEDRTGALERGLGAVLELGRGVRRAGSSAVNGLAGRGAEVAAAVEPTTQAGGGIAAGLLAGAGGAKALMGCVAAGVTVTACVGVAAEPFAAPEPTRARAEIPSAAQIRLPAPATAAAPARAPAASAAIASSRRSAAAAAGAGSSGATPSLARSASSATVSKPSASAARSTSSRAASSSSGGGGEFASDSFEQQSGGGTSGTAATADRSSAPSRSSAAPSRPSSGGEFDASGFETP